MVSHFVWTSSSKLWKCQVHWLMFHLIGMKWVVYISLDMNWLLPFWISPNGNWHMDYRLFGSVRSRPLKIIKNRHPRALFSPNASPHFSSYSCSSLLIVCPAALKNASSSSSSFIVFFLLFLHCFFFFLSLPPPYVSSSSSTTFYSSFLFLPP